MRGFLGHFAPEQTVCSKTEDKKILKRSHTCFEIYAYLRVTQLFEIPIPMTRKVDEDKEDKEEKQCWEGLL